MSPLLSVLLKKDGLLLAIPTSGDIIISEEFVMDSMAGVVCQAESL